MATTTVPAPVCDLFTGLVFGVQLDDPFLLLPSLGALLVGLFCGRSLWAKGYKSQSIPFFGFAVMMTEAGMIHTCQRYLDPSLQTLFWMIDCVLTSSIAASFAILGLQDCGIVGKKLSSFALALFPIEALIVYVWYWAFVQSPSTSHMNTAFHWMYLVEIAICCGLFGLVELREILKGRFDGGLHSLVLGLIAGVLGMKAIFICSWPSVHFSGQFWWFLWSDVAMFFVYRFFLTREQ